MLRIMRSWGKAKEEFNGEKGKYIEMDPEFPLDHTDDTLDIKYGVLELTLCVRSPPSPKSQRNSRPYKGKGRAICGVSVRSRKP